MPSILKNTLKVDLVIAGLTRRRHIHLWPAILGHWENVD